MFSQLGSLFKTQLRRAEQADTRLQIRHEDKEDQGKKEDSKEESVDTSALWEDSTQVSVEALRTFLVEFLKSRGGDVPEEIVPQDKNSSIMSRLTPEYRPPVTNRAARAIKAYSSLQSQNYDPPATPPDPLSASTEEVDLVSLLKADELRTIHVLIAELDHLATKGVQTLTIEKADTFLESLVLAVRLEKQQS